jgi:hypothetical protein
MASIDPAPCRAVTAEDVRDLQRWTRHASRASGGWFGVLLELARDAVERAHHLAYRLGSDFSHWSQRILKAMMIGFSCIFTPKKRWQTSPSCPLASGPLISQFSLRQRMKATHTPHPRHSNPHSQRRAIHVSPPAVSSLGGLRTPAPVCAAPPSWGRHPQTFTTTDLDLAEDLASRTPSRLPISRVAPTFGPVRERGVWTSQRTGISQQ